VIGSGPKGRGFESRHFDIVENPGTVRFLGLLLFPESVEKLGKRWKSWVKDPEEKTGSHCQTTVSGWVNWVKKNNNYN